MKVIADRERCCSSGMCALTAPDVFDQSDDDGRVLVLVAEPASEHHDAVRQAVDLCPSGALSVTDD